jgi:uncharacterized membrane protein YeaQ/YmgE (transglycosylase-associated protein family)
VLIFGLIGFAFMVAWLSQLLVNGGRPVDWVQGLLAALIGSFLGGLLFSLLAGDGLAFRPSGLIGSIIGAVSVTAIWNAYRRSQRQKQQAANLKARRSGRHH